MAAVVGWWGSTRGSPRADLKQEPVAEVVCMGPGRSSSSSYEGEVIPVRGQPM